MGADWRMPTQDELLELYNNTTNQWVTNYNGSGVSGRKFTSKINGNSIFIPAPGYCNDGSVSDVGRSGNVWGSSLDTSNPSRPWYLYFTLGYCGVDDYHRYYGQSVRGVCK